MIRSALQNLKLQEYLARNGKHLDYIILKTKPNGKYYLSFWKINVLNKSIFPFLFKPERTFLQNLYNASNLSMIRCLCAASTGSFSIDERRFIVKTYFTFKFPFLWNFQKGIKNAFHKECSKPSQFFRIMVTITDRNLSLFSAMMHQVRSYE